MHSDKNSIKIFDSTKEHFDISQLQSVLKLFGPKVKLKYEEVESLPVHDYTDVLAAGGCVPDEYIKLFGDILLEPSSCGLSILLTKAEIDCADRIVRVEAERQNIIVIVSLYNLKPDSTCLLQRQKTFLTYAVICNDKYIKFKHFDSECLFLQFKHSTALKREVCDECATILPSKGSDQYLATEYILNSDGDNGHVVIILHGIRTHGQWIDSVKQRLIDLNFTPISHKYGYFDLLSLMLHEFKGSGVKLRFLADYENAVRLHPGKKISIIAHSYGTLIVTQLLEQFHFFKLDRLILVASIVPSNFNWLSVLQDERLFKLMNECGGQDVFPEIANNWVRKAGNAGTVGFSTTSALVVNNFKKDAKHSSLLSVERCSSIWEKFLRGLPYEEQPNCDPAERSFNVKLVGYLSPKFVLSIFLLIIIYNICWFCNC